MESSLSKEIKVGIFAFLGLLAFLVSIVLLGGDKFFFKSTYTLRVELPEVQGLARGSVVSLDGVPVGNIHGLQFIPRAKSIDVSLDIGTEFRNRITQGSRASVKTQGALGDKYIFIEAGPITAAPLEDGATLEYMEGNDLLDMLSKKGAEFGQVVEVIKELKDLLHQLTADGRTGKLMQNLVTDSAEFHQLVSEARKPIGKLDSILAKIDRGDGTLGALINDPTLHNKLTQLFGGSPRNKFLTPMIRESIKESEH